MIATKTTPEAAEAAQKAGLANSTAALLEIARTAPEKQVKKVREIAKERAADKNDEKPGFEPKTEAERLAFDLHKWVGTNRTIEFSKRLRTISATDFYAAITKVVEA